jgi:hypothetical protein
MMRKLILFSILLLLAMPAAGSSPVLVSSYATGTDNTYLWATSGPLTAPSLKVNLRQPALGGANNCGILVASANSGFTFGTVTDGFNTWTTFGNVTAGGMTLKGWYVLGIAAGTKSITITTSGTATGASEVGAWFEEFQNCGTVIGGNGSTSFVANGAVHNLTLSAAPTSGDAALGFFLDSSTPQNFPLEGSPVTVGAGFTALSNQVTFGKLAEVNTATTSTSVGATYPNNGHTILGLGVVVPQGATGTGPPSGMYIDHYQMEQWPTASTQAFTFPFSGNLIVGMLSGENRTGTATSFTDSACTWNTGAWPDISDGYTYVSQIFYGYNCTPSSTNSLTVTVSGTGGPGAAMALMSVMGATASPFDKSAIVPQSNHSTAANLSTVSLTPSALNEMTVSLTSIAWHTLTNTVTDANGHTPRPLFSVNTKGDDADPSCSTSTVPATLDEDNGWAYYINSANTTAITFIYSGTQTSGSCLNNPTGVGGYDSVAVAFKSAGGVGPAPPTSLAVVVQ